MAAHGEAQPHAGAPARLLGELEDDALERDGVIVPDGARLFVAEDGVEVDGAERDEGRGGIGRRVGELFVVGGGEVFAQIDVGGLGGGEGIQLQPVDDAALPGAVEALRAGAGLLRTRPASCRAGLTKLYDSRSAWSRRAKR